MSQLLLMAIIAVYVGLRITHTTRSNNDPMLGLMLLLAAATRIGVGLANHYMGPLPGARIDAIMFDETARNAAATASGFSDYLFELGPLGYSSILAICYGIAGYHFMIPTLVNLVFTIEFLFLVYAIARDWGGQPAAQIATLAAAFYPTSMIYTSVSLREAPLYFGLALYVRALLDYYDGKSNLLNWRLAVGLVLMVWLHDGFALAVFLIPLTLWFKKSEVPIWRRAIVALIGGAVLFAVFVAALNFFDFQKLPDDPSQLLDPSFLATMREAKSAYGVGYGIVEPTWGNIIRSYPLLVFAFVSAPFPIWWEQMGDLPKVAEGLLSLTIVSGACFTVYMAAPSLRKRRRVLFLSMFLYLVLVFAMGTGNTGIAARHRGKLLWMPIVLNAVAIVRRGSGELADERSLHSGVESG